MSEHCTVKLEDIASAFELSPEEVEENDGNCEVRESSKVDNPFTNMLSNLLSGGGRTRRQRIIGRCTNCTQLGIGDCILNPPSYFKL